MLALSWAVFPHFAHINVKFGMKERTWGPLPHAKFHVYRGNVSPLRGEKPIIGSLSKNNTGMAALRAGLPVIIYFWLRLAPSIFSILDHNCAQYSCDTLEDCSWIQ